MTSSKSFHTTLAAITLFSGGHVFSSAFVDSQNRLVVNGTVVTPPAISIDSPGTVTVGGQVYQIPQLAILDDGSLLLEGVTFPIPVLPIRGADSFDDWLALAFPNPADRENPAIAGPMADPLGLGVPNLIRYALAARSANEVFDHLPRIFSDDGEIGLSFPFIGVRSDVRVQVVASNDLVNWNEVLWDSFLDGPAEEAGAWIEVVDTVAASGGSQSRFLRLRVTPIASD